MPTAMLEEKQTTNPTARILINLDEFITRE